MGNTYQIYLISDSTGETLDRVFLAIKAQFKNIEYDVRSYFFTRTENQVIKILEEAKKNKNSIILYTIVDSGLAKFLANKSNEKKIPCFGVLGNLILSFSKLLNQQASHVPSGQHALNEEYYERIEAIQFTMNHDDGNLVNELEKSDLILSFSKLLNQKASHQPSGQYELNDEYYKRIAAIQFTMNHDDGNLVKEINKSDIILLGVSRTSKTPTAIYLANKGFKTSNIPLINQNSVPKFLKENPQITCVVGLNTEPERLVDLRKNRMNSLKETENKSYTDLEKIKREVDEAKNIFRKYKWPVIDVTRKSVEETAASIIKIYEIYKHND